MLASLMLLAAFAPIAPAASTCDPAGALCVVESTASSGDCAAGDGQSVGSTTLTGPGVVVMGASDCNASNGLGSRDNGITATAGPASAQWASFSYDDVENGHFAGCFISAQGGLVFAPFPAALSPPDPGWGHALP